MQYIALRGDIRPRPKNYDKSELEWLQSTGHDEELPRLGPPSQSRHYMVCYEPVIKRESIEDLSWDPVINLIQVVPCLKDLIYDCKSQFPPSLLSALHKQHPQCRLHHLSFRFRTLLWGTPYPYEMELATSPLLYKVKLICTYWVSDYDDDFNGEAILYLVAGIAPNLREVVNVRHYGVSFWKRLPPQRGVAWPSRVPQQDEGVLDIANSYRSIIIVARGAAKLEHTYKLCVPTTS